MNTNIVEQLLSSLLSGGSTAVIAVLIIAVVALVYERKRLLTELKTKDDKIDKIIDDYHKGNITLSEALISLKMVLYEIKGRL